MLTATANDNNPWCHDGSIIEKVQCSSRRKRGDGKGKMGKERYVGMGQALS